MQRLEVSGAVRPIYGSLGVKRLKQSQLYIWFFCWWLLFLMTNQPLHQLSSEIKIVIIFIRC